MTMNIKENIQNGDVVLGIEFGSTRIKAILIDLNNTPLASGSFEWENQYKNGIWTYDEDVIWHGLQSCYKDLKENIQKTHNIILKRVQGIGISGMMHGYIALDEKDELLVPFRTWRNTITEVSASKLTELFQFNIPQRWTIAHLYQAILNNESHIKNIAHLTTLAGFIHYKLTGEKIVGIGEASGIFPIDSKTKSYHQDMVTKFDAINKDDTGLELSAILPTPVNAGTEAGRLTKEGALLIDPDGDLEYNIPLAPPEGDAGTGMVATNSITTKTGNVSAGTSVFAMIVLEKPLSKAYPEIDIVVTPDGHDVAMVHSNNCTSDINAWANMFNDLLSLFGHKVDNDQLYTTLFKAALNGDENLGKLLMYNYFSGEHITGFEEGRPLLVRTSESDFNVANIMKANLFSAIAPLRIGMDILLKDEQVTIESLMGHGGFFRTKFVGQKILASAINTSVSVMETAGEGGPYGMALLTNYMIHTNKFTSLKEFLDNAVFKEALIQTEEADETLHNDFEKYLKKYINGLLIERQSIKSFKG